MRHIQWRKDMPYCILVEHFARDFFYERPERDEVDIAVRKPGARRIVESVGEGHAIGCFLALPVSFQIQIRRQAGVMCQQLADRDVFFSVLRKLRKILGHWIAEAHLSVLHQLHYRGRRYNHFGQGGEVENCILSHGLAPRLKRAIAIRFAVRDSALVADQQDSSWNSSVSD